MLAFVRAARGKVSVDWANPLNTKRSGPNEPLSVDVKRQKNFEVENDFLETSYQSAYQWGTGERTREVRGREVKGREGSGNQSIGSERR